MGAAMSTCCGVPDNKESQIDLTNIPQHDAVNYDSTHQSIHTGEGCNYISSKASEGYNRNDGSMNASALLKTMEKGLDVTLILHDKTRLICRVHFDYKSQCMLLTCDNKVRTIAMRDIKAILHTDDQLRRVEASAGITDANVCAAIHLAANGNCIPVFFANPHDKSIFVDVVIDAKRQYEEREANR